MYAINYKTGEVTIKETGLPDLQFRHDSEMCCIGACWLINGESYDNPVDAIKAIAGPNPSRWRKSALAHYALTWPRYRLELEQAYKASERTDCLILIQIEFPETN